MDLPSIETHPFRVEVTDLISGNTEYRFLTEKNESERVLKSLDSEQFFGSLWNRSNGNLERTTHANEF
jgi:hypothetical protein